MATLLLLDQVRRRFRSCTRQCELDLRIEHVLHALTSVVQRLMVLNFGRMLMVGEPDAVMSSPEVREIYLGIEA